MVEVFKTNVQKKMHSKKLLAILCDRFPFNKINFDLNDCDKILRVEGEVVEPLQVTMLIKENGFECSILE